MAVASLDLLYLSCSSAPFIAWEKKIVPCKGLHPPLLQLLGHFDRGRTDELFPSHNGSTPLCIVSDTHTCRVCGTLPLITLLAFGGPFVPPPEPGH